MHKLFGFLLGSFLLASAASAGPIWTSMGSGGAVDPAAISFTAVNRSTVSYASGSTSTAGIHVRYNVTIDDTTSPAWTTIELLGNNANVSNGISASLYAVDRTTGLGSTLLGSVATLASTSTQAFTGTIGTMVTIDFTANYYVLDVLIARSTSTAQPFVTGVRVY